MVEVIQIEFGRADEVEACTIPFLIRMRNQRGPNAHPLKVGLLMGEARGSVALQTGAKTRVPYSNSPISIARCVGLLSCAAICFMRDDRENFPVGAVVHANCGHLEKSEIEDIKKELLGISNDRQLRDVYVAIAAPEHRHLPDGLASYQPLASSLSEHAFQEANMIIVGIGEWGTFGMNSRMTLGY